MVDAAKRLERRGANLLVVIATNTMHIAAPQLQPATSLQLLHIAYPTAYAIKAARLQRVGLLGTAFMMEQDFYKGRLAHEYGLDGAGLGTDGNGGSGINQCFPRSSSAVAFP